jgi:hypothetical protein
MQYTEGGTETDAGCSDEESEGGGHNSDSEFNESSIGGVDSLQLQDQVFPLFSLRGTSGTLMGAIYTI